MIAKGTQHNNGLRLANYMTHGKPGERAELWQLCGFIAGDIRDAFRDVQIMSEATRAEQPFFHVQVRNPDGEEVSRAQWERIANRIESKLGLTGQPRAIAFHIDERTGYEHMHVAWSRIDEENLTAKRMPFYKLRLKEVSRELEIELGLTRVQNEREGPINYAPTRAEEEQARRMGHGIHEVREIIRDCYDRSDCGRSFEAALTNEGLILARGERRDYVVIDQAGGMHALGKRILDVTAAETRARLSDLVRDELPTVELARTLVTGRDQDPVRRLEQDLGEVTREIEELAAKQRQHDRQAPVWDRDRADQTWQDAVIKAAIEKEKVERQFVEPERDKEEARGRRKREREQERLDAFLKSLPALDPESVGGQIREIYGRSDDARSFKAGLEEKRLYMAVVTPDEARWIQRGNPYLQEPGKFAPRSLEAGEFVVLNEQGHIYQLNLRNTGKKRAEVEAFLGTLDRKELEGVDAARKTIQSRADEREILRQAFRDISSVGLLHRERKVKDGLVQAERTKDTPRDSLDVSSLRVVGKILDVAASAFESLLSPVLTPEQKRDAAIASHERVIAAANETEVARHQTEIAHDRQREEEQRAAARERGGRDR